MICIAHNQRIKSFYTNNNPLKADSSSQQATTSRSQLPQQSRRNNSEGKKVGRDEPSGCSSLNELLAITRSATVLRANNKSPRDQPKTRRSKPQPGKQPATSLGTNPHGLDRTGRNAGQRNRRNRSDRRRDRSRVGEAGRLRDRTGRGFGGGRGYDLWEGEGKGGGRDRDEDAEEWGLWLVKLLRARNVLHLHGETSRARLLVQSQIRLP